MPQPGNQTEQVCRMPISFRAAGMQDDAFVIGAVRKPVRWKVTKPKQTNAEAELPWLERLKK